MGTVSGGGGGGIVQLATGTLSPSTTSYVSVNWNGTLAPNIWNIHYLKVSSSTNFSSFNFRFGKNGTLITGGGLYNLLATRIDSGAVSVGTSSTSFVGADFTDQFNLVFDLRGFNKSGFSNYMSVSTNGGSSVSGDLDTFFQMRVADSGTIDTFAAARASGSGAINLDYTLYGALRV